MNCNGGRVRDCGKRKLFFVGWSGRRGCREAVGRRIGRGDERKEERRRCSGGHRLWKRILDVFQELLSLLSAVGCLVLNVGVPLRRERVHRHNAGGGTSKWVDRSWYPGERISFSTTQLVYGRMKREYHRMIPCHTSIVACTMVHVIADGTDIQRRSTTEYKHNPLPNN